MLVNCARNGTSGLIVPRAVLLLLVAAANVVASPDVMAVGQPLESLHGTVLTAYNVSPAIPPKDLAYVPSKVWAKGDFTRYESIDNGTKVIGIQHGGLMYSFVEGQREGILLRLRGGIGTLGLIRQFELVKSQGEKTGTEIVDGVPSDKYFFEDEETGEQIWALLSGDTGIPFAWIGRPPNGNVTYIFYKDMEANVHIPDELFEIPAEIAFSDNPSSLAKNAPSGEADSGEADSEVATYDQAFAREVIEFANLNRISLDRLNRDVHADCYIPITMATTINSDGSVKSISVVESSSVPVVDRYYRFVIEQAAPYPRLAKYFDPVPPEITLETTFKLDVRLWGSGVKATRECEKLEPRASLPD